MSVPVTVYAFSSNENEVEMMDSASARLSENDFAQAARLVATARCSERWVTATTITLSYDIQEEPRPELGTEPQELQEFVNTNFFYPERTSIEARSQNSMKNSATSQNASAGGTFATTSFSPVAIRKEDPRMLLPKPWRFASKSEHKSLTRLGQRMPLAYVLRYLHPTTPHFYPELLSQHEEGGMEPLPNLPKSPPPSKSEIEQWRRSRLNWIIPINGYLPWASASNGRILFAATSLNDYNTVYPRREQEETITWIPTVLRRFWAYILQHRNDGTLGPLSFAYFPAGAEKAQGLDLPDVIKVRCAAGVALKVRMLLATFIVDPANDGESDAKASHGTETAHKAPVSSRINTRDRTLIAPLRSSRLMLMNDTLEALLLA
ncbi:hypothetical protein FRC17_008995 [Serendipita sp. 399]|nr:hypothetical protein FRC17_008995 [Serendipita sp. 399]